MAFESLSERLSQAMKSITGQGKLTEKNMNDMLKEVRLSLLEADVNYNVVKDFVANVKEKALGQEVMESLNPSQMVVKIVRDELRALLGNDDAVLEMHPDMTTVMMVGLQGTGKTTASAKIARYAKEKLKKKVLLVAADVVRPAAIEQLQTLGAQIGVEVFTKGVETSAMDTALQAMEYAKQTGKDFVIFDTAGRLHVDEELMHELQEIQRYIDPDNILLTVDAMTGQDIVTVAETFNNKLGVTGLVVTKMDGDARGGGLLSVRSITHVPVLFVSNGEKVEDLEQFHPDRMADRILGMGDITTLIEQAEDKLDRKLGQKSMDRMMNGMFTFNDLMDQFSQMEKLGSFQSVLKLVPGLNKMAGSIDDELMNRTMNRSRAIIQSMTPYEREHPECLKAGRKQRIARGSGCKVQDVNKLITQLNQMQQMTKLMSGKNSRAMMQNMRNMANGTGVSKHSGSKKQKKSKKKKKK